MILGKTVLISLHRPWAGQRGADETDPDRLELGGWQAGGGIASPKAVTVARHDREPGDLRIADEVIDFATLVVGAAIIAAADLREGVGHFCLVSPSGRFCGSARKSRAPSELPQIFQVAADRRSWSTNHCFCRVPR